MFEIIATILGIGFLLFIHEAGHYTAARLAGVRVETFSLGFGPRLFGWRRRGTDFRVALIPFGGYVRMAGEDQTRPPLPDELGAKSVGWRFLIYSGGILMNFLFALVAFPVLFAIGVPFNAPVAGSIEPGSPAWEAGIVEGDRVLSVNGEELYAYSQLASTVALSGNEPLELELQGPEGGTRGVEVTARYEESLGFRRLGIAPSFDPASTIQVKPGTPAATAGLEDGDRLLEVDGARVGSVAATRMMLLDVMEQQRPLSVKVARSGDELEATFAPVPDPELRSLKIGIRSLVNQVKEARGGLAGRLRTEDQILSVDGKPFDWQVDLFAAAYRAGGLPALSVLREGAVLELPADPTVDPASLPAWLWLETPSVQKEQGLRIAVSSQGPAWEAGVRTGDLLVRADGAQVDSLDQVRAIIDAAQENAVNFVVRPADGGDLRQVEIRAERLPEMEYGLYLTSFRETVQSKNLLQSLGMGLNEARRMALDVFRMIQRIFTGDVAPKNLGGIITIGELTHTFAGMGWIPLLFFLAIISVNLGAINLLPVPALDGGHLLFLLVEKVRGRPLGEKAQMGFNMIGFVAVLALVIFVTWNDLMRHFG